MLLYEIRVQLQDIQPPIWRQLKVRPQTSLARLHKILQKAMGWTNSHLHLFKVGDKEYGEGDFDWDFEVHDYSGMRLEDAFTKGRKSFLYEYDMGDSWRHEIILLGTVESAEGERIACIAGARACPPEDCGGVTGYLSPAGGACRPGARGPRHAAGVGRPPVRPGGVRCGQGGQGPQAIVTVTLLPAPAGSP